MAISKQQSQSSKVTLLQMKRTRSPNKEEKLVRTNSTSSKRTSKNKMVVAKSIRSESQNPKRLKRATEESIYDTSQSQLAVLNRAKEVEASLAPEFPRFTKVMLPSHVAGGFWLGLPKKFCSEHVPKVDTMFVLEDELREEYEVKYLAHKVGLSGGWRGFSIAHDLKAGDVLVFHRVTLSKFKVHIIRLKSSAESDCALSLVPLDACIEEMDTGEIVTCEGEEDMNPTPILVESPKNNNAIAWNTQTTISDLTEKDTRDLGSDKLGGIQLAESVVPFKEVSSLENFNIIIDGFIINSEFSKTVLAKYYDLCRSQDAYLHEHLLEGLNWQLINGAISEITIIADNVRTCKASTLECNLSTWNKTLKAFEVFGMNVGFLRARLDRLASLVSQSKRCKESRLEKDQAEEEERDLEAKLLEVKETIRRISSEIETLNVKLEKVDVMFQEVANAPW